MDEKDLNGGGHAVCEVLLILVEVRAVVDEERGGDSVVNGWTPDDCGSVFR